MASRASRPPSICRRIGAATKWALGESTKPRKLVKPRLGSWRRSYIAKARGPLPTMMTLRRPLRDRASRPARSRPHIHARIAAGRKYKAVQKRLSGAHGPVYTQPVELHRLPGIEARLGGQGRPGGYRSRSEEHTSE